MEADETMEGSAVVPYEVRLDQDWGRALSEGSRYFEEKSAVQDALHKIARCLDALNVPYVDAPQRLQQRDQAGDRVEQR